MTKTIKEANAELIADRYAEQYEAARKGKRLIMMVGGNRWGRKLSEKINDAKPILDSRMERE